MYVRPQRLHPLRLLPLRLLPLHQGGVSDPLQREISEVIISTYLRFPEYIPWHPKVQIKSAPLHWTRALEARRGAPLGSGGRRGTAQPGEADPRAEATAHGRSGERGADHT